MKNAPIKITPEIMRELEKKATPQLKRIKYNYVTTTDLIQSFWAGYQAESGRDFCGALQSYEEHRDFDIALDDGMAAAKGYVAAEGAWKRGNIENYLHLEHRRIPLGETAGDVISNQEIHKHYIAEQYSEIQQTRPIKCKKLPKTRLANKLIDGSNTLYTNQSILEYIFRIRHGESPACPRCDTRSSAGFYRVTCKKAYSCAGCGWYISPLAGTIFHKSSTPLTSWLYAMILMDKTDCSIAAKELERRLSVTYKTAWRIRNILSREHNKRTSKDLKMLHPIISGRSVAIEGGGGRIYGDRRFIAHPLSRYHEA